MKTLYLISCTSKKQPHQKINGLSKLYEAENLYLSDWFLKAKAYVTQSKSLPFDLVTGYRSWGILSALHGFLEPSDLVAPYDVSLLSMGRYERGAWAKFTMTRLSKYIEREDIKHVVLFAGQAYRHPLMGFLMEFFHSENAVESPLSNMGIGQQLSFFKKGTKNDK